MKSGSRYAYAVCAWHTCGERNRQVRRGRLGGELQKKHPYQFAHRWWWLVGTGKDKTSLVSRCQGSFASFPALISSSRRWCPAYPRTSAGLVFTACRCCWGCDLVACTVEFCARHRQDAARYSGTVPASPKTKTWSGCVSSLIFPVWLSYFLRFWVTFPIEIQQGFIHFLKQTLHRPDV